MKLKNKRILVTGGAGFIGSHIVDELIKKKISELVIVDNFFLGDDKIRNLYEAKRNFPELKIIKENASDQYEMSKIIKECNIDIVFNLAVIPLIASLQKPSWTFQENINITLALCNLLKDEEYEHLIHFSSSEVYGTLVNLPMSESHPLNSITPYAASKASSDLLSLSYYRTFDIPVSIIRPFNNYGPRQNEGTYAGIIPITIKNILLNRPPEIHGDGNQTRDYIYVKDTAKITLDLVESNKTLGKIINLAYGEEISIQTIIDTIIDIMDYKGEVLHYERRKGDVDRHCGDITYLKSILPDLKFNNFSHGIQDTINFYQKYFQEFDFFHKYKSF